MSAKRFFVKSGNALDGPFSGDDLKRLVEERRINPTDFVQQDGSERWHLASSIDGLFPAVPPSQKELVPTIHGSNGVQESKIKRFAIPIGAVLIFALGIIVGRAITLATASTSPVSAVKEQPPASAGTPHDEPLPPGLPVAVTTRRSEQTGKWCISRDEFRTFALQRTKPELINLFGKPDTTTDDHWMYRRRSYDPITDKVDGAAFAEIKAREGSVVTEVRFVP